MVNIFAIHPEPGISFGRLCDLYHIPNGMAISWDWQYPERTLGRDFDSYIHLGVSDTPEEYDKLRKRIRPEILKWMFIGTTIINRPTTAGYLAGIYSHPFV